VIDPNIPDIGRLNSMIKIEAKATVGVPELVNKLLNNKE